MTFLVLSPLPDVMVLEVVFPTPDPFSYWEVPLGYLSAIRAHTLYQ